MSDNFNEVDIDLGGEERDGELMEDIGLGSVSFAGGSQMRGTTAAASTNEDICHTKATPYSSV